jgi:alpha-beta hydrolase superfamily lysophospholipase
MKMQRNRSIITKPRTLWLGVIVVGAIAVIMLAAAGAGGWRTGPAISTQLSPAAFTLAQIEQRLQTAETQFSDIQPGLEKSIIWADQPQKRTAFSIVYIHGFSASKEELRPVPDKLAARLGANIFFTRLTGHGRTADAMRDASLDAWMQDLAEAFAVGTTIGDKVIVISCSTGGTIVAQGVARGMFSGKLFSTVFVSPNFGVQDKMAPLLTWPLARFWAPLIGGEMQTSQPRNARHARYWATSYPTISLIPMMQLIKATKNADMAHSNLPALFYFSPDDKVVDPQQTEYFIRRWRGPKQIVRIAGSDSEDHLNHLITGDVVSPGQVTHSVDSIITWHNRIAGHNQINGRAVTQ